MSAPAVGDERAAGTGRGRWTAVLLVRLGAFAATVFLLQLSGTAAWDAHLLGVRGEVRAAEVVAVRHTSWGKADRATLAVAGEPATVRVATPRKNLEIGQTVGAVVDPRDPRRAALAGDGWPWRQVLIPLLGLPLAAVYAGKYGRWPVAAGDRSGG